MDSLSGTTCSVRSPNPGRSQILGQGFLPLRQLPPEFVWARWLHHSPVDDSSSLLRTQYSVSAKPVATWITWQKCHEVRSFGLLQRAECAHHEGEVAELSAIDEAVDRGER